MSKCSAKNDYNECMLYSEAGHDTSQDYIMFEHLSEHVQQQLLEFKDVNSPYEIHWDILPVAQLPYGTVADFMQDELDLQALTQVGYYSMAASW